MSILAKYGVTGLSASTIKHISDLEEFVGDFKTWPRSVQQAILGREQLDWTWGFADTLVSAAFLLGNGVSPEVIACFAIKERKFRYKESVCRLMDIFDKHQSGKLNMIGYWDLMRSPDIKRKNPEGVCLPDCPFRTNPDFPCKHSGKAFMHWCLPLETPNFSQENEPRFCRMDLHCMEPTPDQLAFEKKWKEMTLDEKYEWENKERKRLLYEEMPGKLDKMSIIKLACDWNKLPKKLWYARYKQVFDSCSPEIQKEFKDALHRDLQCGGGEVYVNELIDKYREDIKTPNTHYAIKTEVLFFKPGAEYWTDAVVKLAQHKLTLGKEPRSSRLAM